MTQKKSNILNIIYHVVTKNDKINFWFKFLLPTTVRFEIHKKNRFCQNLVLM